MDTIPELDTLKKALEERGFQAIAGQENLLALVGRAGVAYLEERNETAIARIEATLQALMALTPEDCELMDRALLVPRHLDGKELVLALPQGSAGEHRVALGHMARQAIEMLRFPEKDATQARLVERLTKVLGYAGLLREAPVRSASVQKDHLIEILAAVVQEWISATRPFEAATIRKRGWAVDAYAKVNEDLLLKQVGETIQLHELASSPHVQGDLRREVAAYADQASALTERAKAAEGRRKPGRPKVKSEES